MQAKSTEDCPVSGESRGTVKGELLMTNEVIRSHVYVVNASEESSKRIIAGGS